MMFGNCAACNKEYLFSTENINLVSSKTQNRISNATPLFSSSYFDSYPRLKKGMQKKIKFQVPTFGISASFK